MLNSVMNISVSHIYNITVKQMHGLIETKINKEYDTSVPSNVFTKRIETN